ncbi:hypothetical protein V6N13_098859 [Hibiscus sabdariffa]
MLEEATAEPSSFERGWVLIETTVIDRIEECLELSMGGHVFRIHLSESETLLRGPRMLGVSDDSSSSGESVLVSNGYTLVPALRDPDQLVDVVVTCVGPIVEGSNSEGTILKEASATMEFGKLLGAKTICREEAVYLVWGWIEGELFGSIFSLAYVFEQFRGLEQFILQRGVSDHALIWLSSGFVDWGPRPFRFLNYWLEKRGHVKLMESEWRRISAEASKPLPILEKLRRLKGLLKVWNR